MLERLFGEEVRAGVVSHALDISDAWKNSYSCSTNHKVWAAKFTARHPNLVALEMSSFKCGHDAPIYGVIEGIIENSGTPYFCFKDLDENKPSGSIRIRVETIDYFLRRYREQVIKRRKAEEDIKAQLAQMEAELRGASPAEQRRKSPPTEHGLNQEKARPIRVGRALFAFLAFGTRGQPEPCGDERNWKQGNLRGAKLTTRD